MSLRSGCARSPSRDRQQLPPPMKHAVGVATEGLSITSPQSSLVARVRTPLVVGLGLIGSAASSAVSGVPLCPLRRILGIPCPSCGLTRSVGAMTRLDFGDAFGWHPLGPLLVAVAVVWSAVMLMTPEHAARFGLQARTLWQEGLRKPWVLAAVSIAIGLLWWHQVTALPLRELAHGS